MAEETIVPMMAPVETPEEDVKLISWNRGGPSLHSRTLHVCAVCFHQTEKTFDAYNDTHRIAGPVGGVGLCVRCWSELKRA